MAAVPEPRSAKGEVTVVELTRGQAGLARRAAEARATVPDLTLTAEVDATALDAAASAAGPTVTDFAVRAAALALREVPRANGAYRDARWELYGRINVGVVVEADGAWSIPTVFDADRRTLEEIAAATRDGASRARAGTLTARDTAGSTFTVVPPPGPRVTAAVPVPIAPHAATLSVGAPRPAALVRDGAVVAGQALTLVLACDHRILHGAAAARFLELVAGALEDPASL
jgi:pyruvate dehydrogenase E2 component (dihydrolipoamide acetyltransferase)